MQALTEKIISTQFGEKMISVHACNIRDIDIDVDVMTISSFYRNYINVRGTLIDALFGQNIDISAMAQKPEIDLREQCNIWLSKETSSAARLPIRRIGCIEMSSVYVDKSNKTPADINKRFGACI